MTTGPRPDRRGLPIRLVVLNFNGGDHTLRCLRHLEALDWPADELQLICVDNASTDGSPERIERDHPRVEVVRLRSNGGFPSNNVAMGALDRVRYVGLVNNDAFVEPGWLRPLVETLDADRGLGAVSSKLVLAPRFASVEIEVPPFDPGPGDTRNLGVMVRSVLVEGVDVTRDVHLGDTGWGREVDRSGSFEWSRPVASIRVPAPSEVDEGAPFSASIEFEARVRTSMRIDAGDGPRTVELPRGSTRIPVTVTSDRFDVVNNVGSVVFDDGAGADRGWLEIDRGQFDQPVDVFAWCGGSVLLRPDYLTDIGLFDERFFLYYEDTDLSWRGRARGWRYRTAPASVARHLHAASTGEGSELFAYYVERNRLAMLLKNAPLRMFLREAWRFVLITASYARRDVVRPILRRRRPWPGVVRRRIRSFLGLLRLVPEMVGERRAIRSSRLVPDREIAGWFVPRGR